MELCFQIFPFFFLFCLFDHLVLCKIVLCDYRCFIILLISCIYCFQFSIFSGYVKGVSCWIGFWRSKIPQVLDKYLCSPCHLLLCNLDFCLTMKLLFLSIFCNINIYISFWLTRKDSRYTEKDAAVVVRQMLKVAAECHLHGLVHRDMKPEV